MGKVAWTDGALNGQQKELQILVNCKLNKSLISDQITDPGRDEQREREVNGLTETESSGPLPDSAS